MRDPRIPSREAIDTLAAELEAQPAILGMLAERWERPDPSIQELMGRRHRRVALVALGSSRDAALVGDWDHSHAYLTVDAGYLAVVSGPTSADAELRRWVVGRGRGLLSLGQPIVEDGPALTIPDDPRLRVLVECPLMETIALRAWAMFNSP